MPAKIGTITLSDLSGGLNIKASPFQLAANQATLLQNFYLYQDGSLIGRRGRTAFNAGSSTLGSGPVQGATRSYVGAANQWLAFYNGVVYVGNDASGGFTASLGGLTTGALGTFVEYLNYVYFADQYDIPYRYNGSSWSVMGVNAPLTAPSASSQTSSTSTLVAGTYQFEVTFLSTTTEGNPGPASSSVVLGSSSTASITLSSIPIGPSSTTVSRNIYGFDNGVSSVYQLVANIPDNTTTTYVVTTPTSTWGQNVPTQNNPPIAGPWVLQQWQGRIWAAGSSSSPVRLFFSEVFEPEVWPTTYYADIPFVGSDKIVALLALGDLLLVFGQYQLFYVYGSDPFTFIIQQSFAENGALSAWSVDRVSNAGVYLGRFGVYAFDGAQETLLSDNIDPQFSGLDPTYTPINTTAAFSNASLIHYDRLRALVISFPTVQNYNDTTYWCFLQRQSWVQDSRPTRLLLNNETAGTLYAWDPNAGILRQWDTGEQDDGVNISAYWQSGYLFGDNAISTKQFTWCTARAQPGGNSIQLTGYVDEGAASDSFPLVLGSSGSTIGTLVIGTGTIGPIFGDYEDRWNASMKGRSIQLRLDVTYSSTFRLSSILQGLREDGLPRYFGATG